MSNFPAKIPFDRTIKADPDQDLSSSLAIKSKKKRKLQKTRFTSSETTSSCSTEVDTKQEWWDAFLDDSCEYSTEISGKMVVLLELLKKCNECGDKLLLFSSCLMTLNFIEKYLKYWSNNRSLVDSNGAIQWLPLVDYCRIDGSTDGYKRREYIKKFNNPQNTQMRLFLISTKAGGIGINLTGANRVIIFDASWNVSSATFIFPN